MKTVFVGHRRDGQTLSLPFSFSDPSSSIVTDSNGAFFFADMTSCFIVIVYKCITRPKVIQTSKIGRTLCNKWRWVEWDRHFLRLLVDKSKSFHPSPKSRLGSNWKVRVLSKDTFQKALNVVVAPFSLRKICFQTKKISILILTKIKWKW